MIFCDNCTQRSAIVFLTPGQLAGQMHAPRIHLKEHMHTEKTRLQHQIWPQKRGQFSDLQFAPFPIEGWFWGPLIGLRNGPRNSAFFPPFAVSFRAQYLVSMAAAATILCVPDRLHGQRLYLLKVSLRNHIIICDQHSYYDCKHTQTIEGPQPRSQKCLFLGSQKQAC